MKLIFIRHGKTTWNQEQRIQGQSDESFLLPESVHAAREVGAELKNYGITHLYTSDLRRTVETMEAINESLQLDPQFESRMREMHIGEFQGKLRTELSEEEKNGIWREVRENPSVCYPGGECYMDMVSRLTEFLEELRDRHEDDHTILLVSHGGMGRIFRHVVMGMDLLESLKAPGMTNLEIIETTW